MNLYNFVRTVPKNFASHLEAIVCFDPPIRMHRAGEAQWEGEWPPGRSRAAGSARRRAQFAWAPVVQLRAEVGVYFRISFRMVDRSGWFLELIYIEDWTYPWLRISRLFCFKWREIKGRKLLLGYSLLITVMGFLIWWALLIVSTTVNKGASITGVSLVQKSRHSGKS